jgi:hypothetical protein
MTEPSIWLYRQLLGRSIFRQRWETRRNSYSSIVDVISMPANSPSYSMHWHLWSNSSMPDMPELEGISYRIKLVRTWFCPKDSRYNQSLSYISWGGLIECSAFLIQLQIPTFFSPQFEKPYKM